MVLVRLAIDLCILVVLARLVLSWFPVSYDSPLGTVYRALVRITEPVLAPLRSVLRPVPVGGVALDLAPTVLILGLALLGAVIG